MGGGKERYDFVVRKARKMMLSEARRRASKCDASSVSPRESSDDGEPSRGQMNKSVYEISAMSGDEKGRLGLISTRATQMNQKLNRVVSA